MTEPTYTPEQIAEAESVRAFMESMASEMAAGGARSIELRHLAEPLSGPIMHIVGNRPPNPIACATHAIAFGFWIGREYQKRLSMEEAFAPQETK